MKENTTKDEKMDIVINNEFIQSKEFNIVKDMEIKDLAMKDIKDENLREKIIEFGKWLFDFLILRDPENVPFLFMKYRNFITKGFNPIYKSRKSIGYILC